MQDVFPTGGSTSPLRQPLVLAGLAIDIMASAGLIYGVLVLEGSQRSTMIAGMVVTMVIGSVLQAVGMLAVKKQRQTPVLGQSLEEQQRLAVDAEASQVTRDAIH